MTSHFSMDSAGFFAALVLTLAGLSGCESKPCSDSCERSGRCSPRGDECVATKAEYCAASRDCADYGRCSLGDKGCVTKSDEDCQRSNKCKLAGECGFAGGRCTARSESDCRASAFCADRGMCRLKNKRDGRAICIK
ncbi:MAG TPA: hypothetical protein DCQ06_00485 [Myxococcales bacterium]|nr:hypothetical protein [Myxococcales bacterium]HAN30048.1 hypothetical protein [Myxococcales bacterium]